MDLFKLGLIGQEEVLQILMKIAEKTTILTPAEVTVITSALSVCSAADPSELWHNSPNENKLQETCETLLLKCLLVLYVKLEIRQEAMSELYILGPLRTKEHLVNTNESFDHVTNQEYKYDDLWNAARKLHSFCAKSSSGCETIEKLSELFFCHFADAVANIKLHINPSTFLKTIGLIFSAYISILIEERGARNNVFALSSYCPVIVQNCLSYLHQCQEQRELNSILNLVVEPYLLYLRPYERKLITQKLWDTVEASFIFDGDQVLKQLEIFPYAILSFMISLIYENDPDDLSIFKNDRLWLILQCGLKHQDPLNRKQSQYILKLCISFITTQRVSVSNYVPFIEEKKDHFDTLWKEYFLCIETLEETQTHVITPVILKLSYFWNTAEELFHTGWIYILYKRMFDYDSSAIRRGVISHLLKLNLTNERSPIGLLQFIPNYLLDALAGYQMFLKPHSVDKDLKNELEPSLCVKLAQFFVNFMSTLSDDNAGKFMKIMLAKIFDGRMWEEVSLYHILRSLLDVPTITCLDYSSATAIIRAGHVCWSMQEPLLASASQANLSKIILRHLDHCNITWEQFTCLVSLLGNITFLSANKVVWTLVMEIAKNVYLRDVNSKIDMDLNVENMALSYKIAVNIVMQMEMHFTAERSLNLHESSLSSIKCFLENCYSRPYISQEKVIWSLEILSFTLEYLLTVSSISFVLKCNNDGRLLRQCLHIVEEAHSYMILLLCELDDSKLQHLKVLHLIFTHIITRNSKNTTDVAILQDLAYEYFTTVKSTISKIQENNTPYSQSVISCLHFLSQILYPLLNAQHKESVLKVLETCVLDQLDYWLNPQNNYNVESIVRSTSVLDDGQQLRDRRKQQDQLAGGIWSCLLLLLQESSIVATSTNDDCSSSNTFRASEDAGRNDGITSKIISVCLPILLDRLQCSGRCSIKQIFKFAATLAPHAIKSEEYTTLVQCLYDVCCEQRSSCNELYHCLLADLLPLLLHPATLQQQQRLQLAIKVCSELLQLSQQSGVRGVAAAVAKQLLRLFIVASSPEQRGCATHNHVWQRVVTELLVPLLLHGPLPCKKLKALQEAADTINVTSRLDYSTNPILTHETRENEAQSKTLPNESIPESLSRSDKTDISTTSSVSENDLLRGASKEEDSSAVRPEPGMLPRCGDGCVAAESFTRDSKGQGKFPSVAESTDEEDNGGGHRIFGPYDESQEVRCYAVLCLLTLERSNASHVSTAVCVVRGLQNSFLSTAAGAAHKNRDYVNSFTHRVKTRVLQAVMVVLPLLDQDECRRLLSWASSSVAAEQQQASVRYLLEWLMAAIVIRHADLAQDLLQKCHQSVLQRPSSVSSFLTSLMLCGCHSNDTIFLRDCLTLSMQWCMGQHFNNRMYAQAVLERIYHHCSSEELQGITDEFSAVESCLHFVAGQGRALRNSENMNNDFIFSCFRPVEHYTLQTLYYELPRLSQLSSEEWLSSSKLSEAAAAFTGLQQLASTSVPFTAAQDHLLAAASPAPWVQKTASVGNNVGCQLNSILEASRADSHAAPDNMQKKMMPWSSLGKELKTTEAQATTHRGCELKRQRSELVVVASLVSKATNLGGLCRTCEALGAGKLVLPSLGVLDDPAFTGLSVAAHKWIPIQQVNVDGLREFVRSLRSTGYTIVGAEQTARSVSLLTYIFPKRTLLLLGNEREGIPCWLLQEVDVCVEIPQFGVTRSLNAHVAGALCVWQYASQHNS